MAAPGVLTPPAHSMAIALQAPSTAPRASAMATKTSKKQDLLAVGRRRLERFQKNKRDQASSASKQSLGSLPQTDEQSTSGDATEGIIPSQLPDSEVSVSMPESNGDALRPLPITSRHDDLIPKRDVSVSYRPPVHQLPTATDGSASVKQNNFSLKQKKHDHVPKQASESLPQPTASEQVDSGNLVGTASEAPNRSFSTSVTNGDGPIKLLKPQPTNHRTISQEDMGSRENIPPFEADRLPTTSSRKDDFAALEQHIEDLTQEKFSLQRGLDKARALMESLSQANSALTEDYNQQGAKVNELKDELTRCREEIRSQEIVLKSIIAERDRARQESATATERSRAFAAEIIALEEKVLKTRSQELKLQKEVESLRDELETCRKQFSSIEKDRLNAISMNEALQEEKIVLLTRIREAAKVASPPKEDASTSTDDLVVENENEPRQSESAEQPTASPSDFVAYPTSLPPDQLGIIESINALVTELGQERDALLRTLRNESNALTQLKIENAELSQKLERQTQQLELAVAQNMARIGTSISPTMSHNAEEMEYIDEGDEVVDRVLGWIMRLFPGGGSSKRGGSKQL